jgi:hypothetical protein
MSEPKKLGQLGSFCQIIGVLFGLFRPMALTKPYAWPPAILINEFDAGIL